MFERPTECIEFGLKMLVHPKYKMQFKSHTWRDWPHSTEIKMLDHVTVKMISTILHLNAAAIEMDTMKPDFFHCKNEYLRFD